MSDALILFVITTIAVVILRGLVIVFETNLWLAIFMLVCFFPLLLLWAAVEGLFNWS